MHHGKKSRFKILVVQILHRNTCHGSICQYNGVVHRMHTKTVIYNYNKSCISYYGSHGIFHWAVFRYLTASILIQWWLDHWCRPRRSFSLLDKQDQLLMAHRVTKWENCMCQYFNYQIAIRFEIAQIKSTPVEAVCFERFHWWNATLLTIYFTNERYESIMWQVFQSHLNIRCSSSTGLFLYDITHMVFYKVWKHNDHKNLIEE